ncbi:MAG: hypothetical protein HZA50_03435 [Planctomycetes bacterium]|nr:hypothetical protein [Planctomycetota bacterium]
MKHGRNILILAGTVFRILWLVATALCVVAGRRLRRWLTACRPWGRWQANIPC